MAHEEQTPRCSSSSGGGGRLSKKLKITKVPQRGMGVAQLEKIISEEQHKHDVAILKPNSSNFRPPPLIPLPPPLPPNLRPLIQITDVTNPSFVSKPMHDGGNNRSRLRNGGDHQFIGENPYQYRRLEHRAYAASMPSNPSGLQYESNLSIWRSQLFQQPSSSSMGNASLGTTSTSTSSSSSSSVMNLQMELPSNQSYCSNNYPPLWPHEEKMVGMKRPYPFSTENMPIPSFNFKFPYSPISRSNESPSSVSREKNTSNLITKDFLTLAPPQQLPSKEKLSPLSVGKSTSPHHQPMYSFFPAATTPDIKNGEEGEHVDLNLKL